MRNMLEDDDKHRYRAVKRRISAPRAIGVQCVPGSTVNCI